MLTEEERYALEYLRAVAAGAPRVKHHLRENPKIWFAFESLQLTGRARMTAMHTNDSETHIHVTTDMGHKALRVDNIVAREDVRAG
jgi:hypothetical protein